MPPLMQVSVVGAGLMGHGIAQVFACAGHDVRVFDTSQSMIDSLPSRISHNLADLGLDPTAVNRVIGGTDLKENVESADIVIEAGPENLQIKQQLFAQIEEHVSADTVLASNTSVIPITHIMAGLRHKERALGTHWWNPPYLVPLVEIIKTEWTDNDVAQTVHALLASAGKTPVIVKKDIPGFIGNRLQHALWREAIALVQNGVCDAETVDTVVKASFGRRLAVLGPLENADLVGTDLTLAIHDTVLPDIDTTRGSLPYLKRLVADGKLGMKSGQGFRTWTDSQMLDVRRRVLTHLRALASQGI